MKTLWIVIGIIVVILIAIAIGLAIYYATKSDETKSDETATDSGSTPPEGLLIGTGTGPSTNKYISVPCPNVQMNPLTLGDCTGLAYNNTTGIVSGSCTDGTAPAALTSLNMAQCDSCNITARNGRLVCDIDYSGCPANMYVDGLDISGNDIGTIAGLADCPEQCTDAGCYWASLSNQNNCFLKKSPEVLGYTSGFALGDGGESCPSYYVIPNTRVDAPAGQVTLGQTLIQCQQKCKDGPCDWYEYNGDTGECNIMVGRTYSPPFKTMYPIDSMQ